MNQTTSSERTAKPTTKTPQGREAKKRGATALPPRSKNNEVLGRLLTEARPRAMAVAMRLMKNPAEAEDAVQDAYVKVLVNVSRFEERAAFTTWLHRIVVNTCLDRLRRPDQRRMQSISAESDADEPVEIHEGVTEVTPEIELARQRARGVVHRALEALTPAHKEAIAWRELEDRSYGEIARLAHCPVGTVMSRLHHARRRIAEELQHLGGAEVLPEAA